MLLSAARMLSAVSVFNREFGFPGSTEGELRSVDATGPFRPDRERGCGRGDGIR